MFNKGPKLNVRLPGDAEHGPNPYDSKTPIRELGPKWLSSWAWWVQIILFALVLVAVRYFTNGNSFT